MPPHAFAKFSFSISLLVTLVSSVCATVMTIGIRQLKREPKTTSADVTG